MKPYLFLSDDQTFAFSAENPTGTRGGGSRGGDCTKLSPTVRINPGETVTLASITGSGMIQNIWFLLFWFSYYFISSLWCSNSVLSLIYASGFFLRILY